MRFTRHFTSSNLSIEDQIKWKFAESKITDANGKTIFHMQNIEVPESWSQNATNILAQKYFRKNGVPNRTILSKQDFTSKIPTWLLPSVPDETNLDFSFGPETSAKQVFHRLAGCWTYWGWKEGIFKEFSNIEKGPAGATYSSIEYNKNSEENAQIFYDEIYYILANQIAAPNSPQWFNTGLFWAYGITGDANGQWAVDPDGNPFETTNSYEYPQPHACFIQPIEDNLVEKNGIMDLWIKEARLFKHGSGTGTNFSNIRGKGEKLSSGGVSSGLMSFLKIGDVVAGSIASGGTTRRAAKMVCLDLDHPEIEEFINWKMNEEGKAAALYIGSNIIRDEAGLIDGSKLIPQAIIDRTVQGIQTKVCDLNFEGEAINTVSGQNANNSIRITNDFLYQVDHDLVWHLNSRSLPLKVLKTIRAKDLWNQICRAAWACGDPGLQFHDTINKWHTCKTDGQINASNPCSEYMFLDNTACNLASLNLTKFFKGKEFLSKDFDHVTRLFTIVLEISVYMAAFPSKEIAENSYLYRTLGLGYMNLGALLMRLGLPYDSVEGRLQASYLTALMHGISYLTSSEMAKELGPFPRWENNKEPMLEVIKMHYDCVSVINPEYSKDKNLQKIWDNILSSGEKYGFRNAQVTLQAPTGTIHLLCDCDTSGIEPDFSLVKYKQLSGGGNFKIVNESIPEALRNLGYTSAQIQSISQHILEHETIEGWKLNGQELPEEHLKVFDCANKAVNGTRYLRPISHILMMAAIQPFLSGAISKTCNLPNHSTIEEVDFIYREAHKLGLKAIAIYRDGSKLTQPLLTQKKENKQENHPMEIVKRRYESTLKEMFQKEKQFSTHVPKITNGQSSTDLPATSRRRLSKRRRGYRQEAIIDGQKIYLSTGEYEDGKLGEIWLEISREGSTVRALLGAFSKLVSLSLQFGVPLEQMVKAFVYTKFEPSGIVEGHSNIKMTTSVLDFVFRDLAINYLNQKEFANSLNGLDTNPPQPQIPISPQPHYLFSFEERETETKTQTQTHLQIEETIYLGNLCPNCGHATIIRTGSCITCSTCGMNSGCG